MISNYLLTENPYHLAPPPQWWLTMLSDYDAELVVFPSRMRMAYILARRRHFTNAMAEADTLDKNLLRQTAGMDGDILATNNLIYVRHLIGEQVRKPNIVQWLRDHDTVANGGAEKVATRLEDSEADIQARKRRKMLDDIDHRARDAYRSYKARTGQRTAAGVKKAPARQMPVNGFTPSESPLAAFVRD